MPYRFDYLGVSVTCDTPDEIRDLLGKIEKRGGNNKIPKEDADAIVKLRNGEASISEVARATGHAKATVNRHMRVNGLRVGPKVFKRDLSGYEHITDGAGNECLSPIIPQLPDSDMEALKSAYAKDPFSIDLGKAQGLEWHQALQILRSCDVPVVIKDSTHHSAVPKPKKLAILDDYMNGGSASQVAKKHGVAATSLTSWLWDAGIPIRVYYPPKSKNEPTNADRDLAIMEFLGDGATLDQAAAKFDVTIEEVRTISESALG